MTIFEKGKLVGILYPPSGKTPLRELVYRVHKLPARMRSIVYDFGNLSDDAEKQYILQIVSNHVSDNACSVFVVLVTV